MVDKMNYDFDAIYAYLVEKFYFLRESYIKSELEDTIQFEFEDDDELDEDTIIETFSDRIFGYMSDGNYECWVREGM